jgi:hypothetical protein
VWARDTDLEFDVRFWGSSQKIPKLCVKNFCHVAVSEISSAHLKHCWILTLPMYQYEV